MTRQLLGEQEDCHSSFFQCSKDDFLFEKSTCQLHYYRKIFMAVYSCDMIAAAHWIKEGQSLQNSTAMVPGYIPTIYTEVLQGLVALHFARNEENTTQQWTEMGETAIKVVKKWADSSHWNFSNKLYILEAEYYFLKNDEIKATEK